MKVGDHILENKEWIPQSVKPHPQVDLSFKIDCSDYERFGFACPTTKGGTLSAIADSGAQCCVWGVKDFLGAGFSLSDLFPVKQGLTSVSKSGLKILGACFLRLSGVSGTGKFLSSGAFTYVSPDVSGFYLSQNAMGQLGILPSSFPSVGAAAEGDVLLDAPVF